MKKVLLIIGICMLSVFPKIIFGASLSVFPENPIQGEPIMLFIQGTTTLTNIKDATFDKTRVPFFLYKNQPTGLYGIDINKTPGTYKVVVRLADGNVIEKEVTVGKREKIEAPLGIPQKLGGNTATSAATLVSTLAQENADLLNVWTGTHAFWKEKFIYPVSDPIVTDPYGYSRQTGGYTLTHKGTDFRAPEGTSIMAMNRGVVRLAKEYRNYGNTIVVDHGLGLMTFYMHLSKIAVNVGELVLPGQIIGLAGQTGYAEKPHLHLTVRINHISIDPMKFLGLFK